MSAVLSLAASNALAWEPGNGSESVLSRYKVQIHGKIQLDVIFDDSTGYPGPYLLYGISEQLNHDDNHFYITANSSRLSLSIESPERNGKKLSGFAEVDFQGEPLSGTPDPLLRHAYLKYSVGHCEILAGQTWDLISPLRPDLLNWAPAWGWGNIGFWHPQLRVSYLPEPLEVALAISQPVGDDVVGDGFDSGEDSGYPNFQARVGFKFSEKFGVGISGHFGEQELDDPILEERYVPTWSANLDLMFPIKMVQVTWEFFIGQNLKDYMGGVLQGVHVFTNSKGETVREGFPAIGGWINFGFGGNTWKANIGGSIDDVHDYKLYAGSRTKGDLGDRTQNMVFWSNFTYEIIEDFLAGFEFSHTETLYNHARKGEPNRYQLSLIYSF